MPDFGSVLSLRGSSADSIQVSAPVLFVITGPWKFPEGEGRWSTSGRPSVMNCLAFSPAWPSSDNCCFFTSPPSTTPRSRPLWPISAAFSAPPPTLPSRPHIAPDTLYWKPGCFVYLSPDLKWNLYPLLSLWRWPVFLYPPTSGSRSKINFFFVPEFYLSHNPLPSVTHTHTQPGSHVWEETLYLLCAE